MEKLMQKIIKFLWTFVDPQEWYDIVDREKKAVLIVRDDN